jgi:hypothetical protein
MYWFMLPITVIVASIAIGDYDHFVLRIHTTNMITRMFYFRLNLSKANVPIKIISAETRNEDR